MAGLAYHKIITKGLHGGPACEGLITSHFSLYCSTITIPPSGGGGGGYYPGPAWNKVGDISKFYTPVEQQQYYQQSGKVAISITVAYKEHKVEKIYLVTPKQKELIVKGLKLLNVTYNKISVHVGNIHRRTIQFFKNITNFRNKNYK